MKTILNNIKSRHFRVCEWLLFIANSAIFQLYHGEKKLIFARDDDELRFVLDQHAELDFYSASSLKRVHR
jgi:hypothetical protein